MHKPATELLSWIFLLRRMYFNMLLGFTILKSKLFFVVKKRMTNARTSTKRLARIYGSICRVYHRRYYQSQIWEINTRTPTVSNRLILFYSYKQLIRINSFFGNINSSGNISFTLVLAVFSLLLININGNKDYWKHILPCRVCLNGY